jgi:hypothetical protein
MTYHRWASIIVFVALRSSVAGVLSQCRLSMALEGLG